MMAVKQDSANLRKKKSRLINSRNSLSENDLRTTRYQELVKTGLPPGITVDELWLYCRKRRASPNQLPKDNLQLLSGSYDNIKSEYRKHFKNFYNAQLLPARPIKPHDSLIIRHGDDSDIGEHQPEYNENFLRYPIGERPRRTKSDSFHLTCDNENGIGHESDISEIKARYIRYSPIKRPLLQKRSTNLKLDGDRLTTTTTTEYRERFIQHLLEQRPVLHRSATTLKIDVDAKMDDVTTENREKFIKYDDYQQCRPPLCKKFTNLHLEGDLNILTENREQFIDYQLEQQQQRPPLIKKLTNLRVGNGELDLLPEYRREFIEYANIERPKLVCPSDNLKTDGFTEGRIDDNVRLHPQIPFLRDYYYDHQQLVGKSEKTDTNAYIESFSRRPENKKPTRRLLQQKLAADIDSSKEKSPKKLPNLALSSSGGEFEYGGIEINDPQSLKHVPELQPGERFECQPEYRKAYINYLQREHVERKPRTVDHLACSPPQRAVEIESVVKQPQPQPAPTETHTLKNRPSTINRNRKKSLAQIETNAFGAKLTVGGRQSRSPSPTSTIRSATSSHRQQPQPEKIKRFDKSVLVENLATIRPKTNQPRPPSTTLPLLDVTTRNKWMRDSSIESSTQSTAFVVLDNGQIINNNHADNNNNNDRYIRNMNGYYAGRQQKKY